MHKGADGIGMEWIPFTFLGTNTHSTNVSGIGVTLYFNLLVFLGCIALMIWLGCQAAFFLSSRDYQKAEAIEDKGCAGAAGVADGRPTLLEDKESFTFRMFSCLGVTYLVVVIASWAFFLAQLKAFHWFHSKESFLSRFALFVQGLPPEATDETALKKLFQAKIGGDTLSRRNISVRDIESEVAEDSFVVGVSICYALAKHTKELEEGIDAWIMEKEGMQMDGGSDVQTSRTAGCCQLQFIDDKLAPEPAEPALAKQRVVEVMQNAKCSGSAFVVLSSDAAVRQLADALQKEPEVIDCRLTCSPPSSEPLSVMWTNFQRPEEQYFYGKMVIGFFAIIATIAIWAMLYMPYALEYLRHMHVPGHRPSPVADIVLGALIGIGNVLVGNVIEMVMEWVGFRFKDGRDMWILGLAFFANLLNVVADVSMTLEVAKGAHLDDAFHGDTIGYDRVVVRELFALIVPGYLLVPYLLQPLVEYVLPFWVYRWLVRSDTRFHQREAEKALEPPIFDIVWRFADSLCNFVICIILLLFISPGSSAVMLWLLVYVVYIYCVDKLRLCHHSLTMYTTQLLSIAFTLWWSIPTAVLAGVVGWWGVKAGMLTNFQPYVMVSLVVIAHLVIYLTGVALLYMLVPSRPCAKGEYIDALQKRREAGRGWDYFTANPGHCLKTWGSKTETFVCTLGKMHLLPWSQWDCGGASHNFAAEVEKSGLLSRVPGVFAKRAANAAPRQA